MKYNWKKSEDPGLANINDVTLLIASLRTRTASRLFDVQKVKPLTEELCIYGDLLTLLGTREDKDYLQKLDNLDQVEERGLWGVAWIIGWTGGRGVARWRSRVVT